jgi:hypothetical protein
LLALIACADDVDSVTDAAGDCAPIGEPGSTRSCPVGCVVIHGAIRDATQPCQQGLTIVAGRYPNGPPVGHSGAISCYTTANASLVVQTVAIFPELMEQGWELCSQELYSQTVGHFCP